MANSASKLSNSAVAAAINLTTEGGRGYFTFGSGNTINEKTGATGIFTAVGYEWDTPDTYGRTAGGGFGSGAVTTTDATPSNLTANGDCPYIILNVPFGHKITVAVLTGTQTLRLNGGINAQSNALPLQCNVYDASSTLLLSTTLSGYTAGTDTDYTFELELISDADETWTVDIRTDAGTNAYNSYVGCRWGHITTATSADTPTEVNGLLGTATASGFLGAITQDVDTDITGIQGVANATGYDAEVSFNTEIDGLLGTADASGLLGDVTVGFNISGLLGTADAAGYQAEVSSNYEVDGVVGVADASGFLAGISTGSSINGLIGTADALGFLATIDKLVEVDGIIGTATANGFVATIDNVTTTVIAGLLGTANASGYQGVIDYTVNVAGLKGTATAAGFDAEVDYVSESYGFAQDIQQLTNTGLVEFFVIDLTPIGIDEQYYFHNGINGLGNDVIWQGQLYTRFPIDAEGFEWKGTGTQPRPTLKIANVTGLMSALAEENDDMVGVQVTRKRTFAKYLDSANFSTTNVTADPNVHGPDEVWFVDRKSDENWIFVEWELRSAGDLSGVFLPARQCIQNVCLWEYRSAECGYSGGAVADTSDIPVTDVAFDVCGKRLSSCKLRFPEPAEIPFGGFPALGLIK